MFPPEEEWFAIWFEKMNIYENFIILSGYDDNIYLLNIDTGELRKITSDSKGEPRNFPAIYGDVAIWRDAKEGGLYMYSLKSGVGKLLTGKWAIGSIWGNYIVWSRSGDGVFLYNIFSQHTKKISPN